MSAPTVKHWGALEQILYFLKKPPGLGIFYISHTHTYIVCFVEVDCAGSKNKRISTTAYCTFVGGILVA